MIEHRWSERLTNIVTHSGFLKARDEFLDLAMPLAAQGIERVYGGKYDVTGFVRYFQTEGRQFLEQAAEALYDSTVAHEPQREEAVRLAKIAERFGLDLFDAKGALVTSIEGDVRLDDFFRHRILLGVRHRDGSRLTEAEFRSLFPKDSDLPTVGPGKASSRSMRKSSSRSFPRILRMTGLYWLLPGSAASIPEFAFALRLPGEIVETNGMPHGRDQARWQFTGDRSFPDGYTMTARSLEIDEEGQRNVLGRVPIGDRASAEALLKILDREGPLLKSRATGLEEGQSRAPSRLRAEFGRGTRPGSPARQVARSAGSVANRVGPEASWRQLGSHCPDHARPLSNFITICVQWNDHRRQPQGSLHPLRGRAWVGGVRG